MSFIDLATLALHRRNEMEERIIGFEKKCESTFKLINKMKQEAKNLVNNLNCEPRELKERFLSSMTQLDEYIYLITDINLSLDQVVKNTEQTPVHDSSMRQIMTPVMQPFNIMDVLSEPTPSTSTACQNKCPVERFKRRKIPKEEQTLIVFSSQSCSSESVPTKAETLERQEQEIKCELSQAVNELTLTDPGEGKLPAQTILNTDQVYPATIMNVDGASIWVITDNPPDVLKLITEMTDHYKENFKEMSDEELGTVSICAYYDDDTDLYYRGFLIRLSEQDEISTQVFLVDSGELRAVTCPKEVVQPLLPRFCAKPPYARCCHLAGVDFLSFNGNKDMIEKQASFMKQYIHLQCTIEVEDNASESLGVYVFLTETETLNAIVVQQGWAISTSPGPVSMYQSSPKLAHLSPKLAHSSPLPSHKPPELCSESEREDIDDGPEYEDPVEAVTGYSCRDEADICKHYKGGSEKSCFKGTRCKKKHILKHPDGWTLDRVEVTAKCPLLPLPAPDTWLQVHVTCICHFDRLYVQIVRNNKQERLPNFGVVLPPTTLDSLILDMNSPAARMAYKPLTMIPAPGELVAALYPLDDQWYRARVLSVTRADQSVEVQYIDYGNVVWVKENAVRQLEPRHTQLPMQAVRCALAGVHAKSHDSKQWADAKDHLSHMTLNKSLEAHIIARDYDEVTVELYDEAGYSIAEQLAALNVVTLKEYEIIDDTNVRQKHVVP